MKNAINEAIELNRKYDFFISINKKANGKFPVAIKDNICVRGMKTTAGSRILENYYPLFNATIVKKLKDMGAGIIGKTSMDEFGFGTFSVNCGYRIPKNPLDPKRSCGGSSGGSAGYVSTSKYAKFAIGQSTGGSITSPASFCGVVGLTPTYGLVSRYGLISYANSLDKIGILSKTVSDSFKGLNMIAGYDPKDSTSIAKKKNSLKEYGDKIKIGIPKEYFENIDKKIKEKVLESIKKAGYEYEKVSLPHTKYSIPAYYIIALCESSTNLAKFCGLRYGKSSNPEKKGFNDYFSDIRSTYFGKEAKRRIILGTFARMSGFRNMYYLKALKIRTLIINDFKKAFKKVDVLASPSMPMIAPKFSEIEKLTPIQHYMSDILTASPNLAGIPQLSVPCGLVNKMPIGLQLLADHFLEEKLLKIGKEVEKNG